MVPALSVIAAMQLFLDTEYFVIFHLFSALFAPVRSDSFLFWPFLLSSVVIALLAWAYWSHQGALGWRQVRERFLSARLWWHRSARADYRLYFVNALLFPALFGALLFRHQDVAVWLDAVLDYSQTGAADGAALGWKLAYTLLFFVAYDLGRFVSHSLLHDVPVLWEFHKVHHSAQVLTPITAFRSHPVDLLLMAWGGTAAAGLLAWAFNHFAGASVDAYLFMGVHALLFASNLMGNLNHTSVWINYGPALGKWLISPAHHQVHHSCEARHLGCNRGFQLAIWDRLYGTLYVPTGPEERFDIGLDDGTTEQWHSVRHMLIQPFKGAARVMLRRRSSEKQQ